MRSADKSLTVAHFRISFTPALKDVPGEETKTIEQISVFDCRNHEYWNVYIVGLPSPALRGTVPGSGSRRQILVNNFNSDAARTVDGPGVTVAAFACKQ
jgi:hypothetical protein